MHFLTRPLYQSVFHSVPFYRSREKITIVWLKFITRRDFYIFNKLSDEIQWRVSKIWMWKMNKILFPRQLFQNAAIFEAWPGEKIRTLFVADGSWNDRLSGFRGPWSLNWTGLLAGSSWMFICFFINYDWYIWLKSIKKIVVTYNFLLCSFITEFTQYAHIKRHIYYYKIYCN